MADVRQLLRVLGFQEPDDDECGRLQAYWDEFTAQGRMVDVGSAEIALRYAACTPADD